jgi:hypothetical protein
MARLVCMYGGTYPKPSTLDPRTEAALQRPAVTSGLEVEWIDTSADMQIYADEMEKRWLGTEDLIIVEQDKEPFPGQIEALAAGCPEPWCGYTFWGNPVPHTALIHGGFGVTRFSAEVQRWFPVSAFRGESQLGIDRRFYDLLISNYGKGCCLHGHVLHHHVYEPRPEAVRRYVRMLRESGLAPPAVYPEPLDPGLLPGSYRLPGR